MLRDAGFLGTGASLGADLTLIVEIVLFIGIIVAVIAQRRGKYKLHDRIQIPVVLFNLAFIIFIMLSSFREQEVARTLPQRPTDSYYLVVAIHAGLGLIAEGLAIYCLLAGLKILPRKIGQLRYFMWTTLVFWSAAVFFGIGTYYVWYLQNPEPVAAETGDTLPVGEPGSPAPRRVLMQNFAYQPGDLTVVAGTEVTWLNQDSAPHNVTFADGQVASENYFRGETFSVTFDEVGQFTIFCTLHGNAESGMTSTITVLADTADNQAVAEAAPTPNPIPPTATPAPAVPPPPPNLIEPPAPETTVVGIVSFHDVLGHSDQVQVVLSGLAPPPAGSEYQAWLVESTSGRRLDLGVFRPEGDGRAHIIYDEPDKQNLLEHFDAFQITEEPQFDDDPSPGRVVYSGRQPAEATSHIREITVRSESSPGGHGYALAVRTQTEELLRHVETLSTAYELLSIADSKRHAEHIVNLLEGENGEFFGDLDGVHGAQNPGDGFGIIPYVTAIHDTAVAAGAAGDATNAVRVHSQHVTLAAANSVEWAGAVRQAALEILEARSVGEIGPQVEALNHFGNLLLNGEDSNGDGNIAPEEGGIFTAYQHAQYMAAIGVASGESGVVDIQPAAPDEEAEAAQSLGETIVNMLDFRFEPLNITVPAGAIVRFINIGQAPHSATAGDGSWDTGLFDGGGEATIAFPEPGSYAYYCLLHGTPDGNGMAGTITVEE